MQDWSFEDWVHYIVVFGVLLLAWVPVMNFFGGSVLPTAITTFLLFVGVDKIMHEVLG